jgi:hypothetical protein
MKVNAKGIEAISDNGGCAMKAQNGGNDNKQQRETAKAIEEKRGIWRNERHQAKKWQRRPKNIGGGQNDEPASGGSCNKAKIALARGGARQRRR